MMFLNWFYTIRAYVQSYGSYIKARWLLTLVWALAFAAIIWFYGDSMSLGGWRPLASVRSRLIAIALVFAIWLFFLVWRLVRARRADSALIGAVADDPKRAAGAEVNELRSRLKTALKSMRKALGGRNSIYKLPWYVLIGPPGAGKTTALCNSGLKFPLAGQLGTDPVQGVGGTRHCDWWFTDEAILIDTAGRYVVQNSEAAVDKAGWTGFLKLLKRHRRRQPLNGALVMLGLDDVLHASPTERLQQARAIRVRLREIDEAFKLRLPVYLIFTKVDRLAGFAPFFGPLPHSAREQVWGVTLPLPAGDVEGPDLAARIARGFDRLVERLNGMLLERLQREVDRERRTHILAFPSQLALLSEPLHEMIGEMTASSRFDPPPRVRGLYLASGHQDGAPADLVTSAASVHFGVDLPKLAGPQEAGVKSFFLARLFKDVIFGEAALVGMNRAKERLRRRVRQGAAAVAGLIVASLCAFWLLAYFEQSRLLADTDKQLEAFAGTAKAVPTRDIDDAEIAKTVGLLDKVRDKVVAWQDGHRPYLGVLDQSEKVRAGDGDLYGRALDLLLAPRLMVRQQQQVRARPGDPANADRDRIFLMVAGRLPMDPVLVRRFLAADAQALFPKADQKPLRESLDRHVAALIAKPILPIAVDDKAAIEADGRLRVEMLSQKWAASGQACEAALVGRYPFDRHSIADLSLEDFARLFAPGGTFDTFFRTDLQQLADTSRRPWKWRQEMPSSREAGLAAFEQAADIRTAFFPAGGATPSFTFELTPMSLEGGVTAVLVSSDGQEINYTGGPARGTTMTWPKPVAPYQARISVQPDGPGGTIVDSGPWALFRLIASGSPQPLDAGRVKLTFDLGGRQANFAVLVANTVNPFALPALHEFKCPRSL